jgi:2-dehydro-3-deoxy-D-arabinonate dehydratase
MKLYRTTSGYYLEENEKFYLYEEPNWDVTSWDALLNREQLSQYLRSALPGLKPAEPPALASVEAPIGTQEVWAAGVTYYRSRDARMEESKSAGGGDFYHRVYDAPRPELFFKATPQRVVGPEDFVAIRDDASWSVPEPEFTLFVNALGEIAGYTIGNDMSSRDIEGENPLYLPQAKVYDRSCSLGPCLLVAEGDMPRSTEIRLTINRGEKTAFEGQTTLESLKREPRELVNYLFRNNRFSSGCFLLTGTGIVPPDDFTLQQNDEIQIAITGIGTLINRVG